MKKIKLIILALTISFSGVYAMEIEAVDGQEGRENQASPGAQALEAKDLETGLVIEGEPLSLDQENKKLLESTDNQANAYLAMATLYQATKDVDPAAAQRVIDMGWRNHHFYQMLTKSNKQKLAEQFAGFKEIVGDKFPCSPAWVALECALDAFEKGEQERHQKLVEIIKIIIEPKENYWEFYPMRSNYPMHYSSYFLCCLAPLCYACVSVKGGALHRVAQTNDCILMDVLLKKYDIDEQDSEGCTPIECALIAEAKDQIRFLAGRGASVKNVKHLTCGYCWSCYTQDPEIIAFIKDQPGYTGN